MNLVLSGYEIPAGTKVFYLGQVVATEGRHFKDPYFFNPERFLEDSEEKIHPFAISMFGKGIFALKNVGRMRCE